ncbi:MAG: ribonuclease P protein component [Pseudomonas sp.]
MKSAAAQIRQGLKSADFERALRSRPLARTLHFSLHHLQPPVPGCPGVDGLPNGLSGMDSAADGELSTGTVGHEAGAVDSSQARNPGRLGLVVPKRWAKRAVTRNLIRRQARAVWSDRVASLPAGDWVLRLKTAIDKQAFPSAASPALSGHLREELLALFDQALRRAR